ncbi:O-phosphoserine--tRNA ligase [Candidatus Parcubacteria bacterium]|nr:O-phosphoserine--tRNA ligase [Candidatus Parcubacteria bacterium]
MDNDKIKNKGLWDIKKLKEKKEKDFEKTWLETAKLLPRNTHLKLKNKGTPNLVAEMIEKSRKILLNAGFREVINKTILPEDDIYKQYGPESPLILDRTYYLATPSKPDIGLSKKRIEEISKIIGSFTSEKLQNILRDYKKGIIEGDDLIEEIVNKLKIKPEQATAIIEKVFPEFKKNRPVCSNLTLRGHMTATWYHTLAALQDKEEFPIALFSVGPRYRNEQREDFSHLCVHNSASMVIMDPEISIEAGRKITKEILKEYGFKDAKFEKKKATAKYYAPEQEEEVFVKKFGKWIEIANIGMYSPISLANFKIRYPVFNAGFGIERLAMVLENIKDIRKLVYPQFYEKEYTDEEIAESISYIKEPSTLKCKKIAESIEKTARKEKDEASPCEIEAYKDNSIKVEIIEKEENKKLIGPAGLNYICVKDENIYPDISQSGIPTGKSYISGIANAIAYEIEKGNIPFALKVKTVKGLSDINMKIPKHIRDYLEGKGKKIGLSGYAFVEIQVKKNKK